MYFNDGNSTPSSTIELHQSGLSSTSYDKKPRSGKATESPQQDRTCSFLPSQSESTFCDLYDEFRTNTQHFLKVTLRVTLLKR